MKRFREGVGQVRQLDGHLALEYFRSGLDVVRSQKLVKNLMFNILKDLSKVYDIAEEFIAIEEAMGSLKPNIVEKPRDRDKNNNPQSDNNGKTDN